ncbi:MAG: isoprenylcysteine carboxylmethyltransferase family protein [Desulfobacteraceae bacterium]|nr:isoprenylcysteine carboxylmethyltransferase family protein [Desulfobacteraceae bacterium]
MQTQYKDSGVKYLALILGGGSLFVFILFLISGPFNLFDFQMKTKNVLLFDALLSLLFFIQHSLMARQFVRDKISQMTHKKYDAAIYAIASGSSLLLLIIFWQRSFMLISPGRLISWGMYGIFVLAVAGMFWGFSSLDFVDPLGVRALSKRPKIGNNRLLIRGAYRFVRHPLYLFSLVMIWAKPDLTADRLLFNFLFTIWIVLACRWEENDLIQVFGDDYIRYQSMVPMIFPVKPPVKEE